MEMNNDQYQARIAAENDAKIDVNKIIWFFIGLFLNIIGIPIAYIYQPSPTITRILGKSQMYVLFYERIYKSKVRKLQLIYTFIGFVIPYLIGLILIWL